MFALTAMTLEAPPYSREDSVTPYCTEARNTARFSSDEMPWSMENFLFNAVISLDCGGES